VTSLLQDDVSWDVAEEREFLLAIDSECDRLTRLVGNLLDASRLQADAVDVGHVDAALDDVLAAALHGLPGADGPARLVIELPDDLPLVSTDPDLLERVLANVIANALRYSPPGRPVRISADAVNDRVELLVIDRGQGIPAARRDDVLRPFQRLGDENPATGLGLGLAVAHGFTELLGGRLLLQDTPGGGLTVTISLPRSTPPTDGREPHRPRRPPVTATPAER
jgi:two-component system sensor histidine kinase KdpD